MSQLQGYKPDFRKPLAEFSTVAAKMPEARGYGRFRIAEYPKSGALNAGRTPGEFWTDSSDFNNTEELPQKFTFDCVC
ncbi:hypothetical protein Trydic_g3942 [Trypoxylus dichotomus]